MVPVATSRPQGEGPSDANARRVYEAAVTIKDCTPVSLLAFDVVSPC